MLWPSWTHEWSGLREKREGPGTRAHGWGAVRDGLAFAGGGASREAECSRVPGCLGDGLQAALGRDVVDGGAGHAEPDREVHAAVPLRNECADLVALLG